MNKVNILLLSVFLISPISAFADYESILKKAKKGNAETQYALGTMYQLGKGVSENDNEAFKWTRLAAIQGYAKAQNNLGYMYDMGEGVAQDDMRAYMWKYLAAAQGELDAAEHRDEIASQMSKQELEVAQKMANDCKSRNYKGCD
jgi:TPR repeat protein